MNNKFNNIYMFLIIVFAFISQLFINIPLTNAKYTEKQSKKITINAVQLTYQIEFDANNGTSNKTYQTFTYKKAERLNPNTFTNGTFVFVGWNTEIDGSGQRFEDKELVSNLTTINGDIITLYAQWVDKVARIGDVYYDTLQEAVAVANASTEQTTIVLIRSTNENIEIKKNKNVVLDLNGKTLGNVGNVNTIKNYGTLLLKNGNVITNATGNGAINNYSTGTITIDGVNVTVYGTGKKQAFYNDCGIATIKGGSVLSSIATERPAVTNLAGSMTIIDASIISTGSSGLNNTGTLIIGSSNEPINTTTPSIMGVSYGLETNNDVLFYDGIIKGKTSAVNNDSKLITPSGYFAVDDEEIIDGNTYFEKYVGIGYTVNFDPNGGTINDNDEIKIIAPGDEIGTLPELVRTGYTFDGWYTDIDEGEEVLTTRIIDNNETFYAHWTKIKIAKIGDVYYESLQDAINDAPNNVQTRIELVNNNKENVTIPSNKNIIFDTGNYTLSNLGNNAVITNNGTLKIVGGIITSNADTATINQVSGSIEITSGNILGTGTRQALYVSGGVATISGDAYLSSKTTGTPTVTTMQRGAIQCLSGAVVNIYGGTIVGVNQHGVSNEGTINIGLKDGTITISSPTIIGNNDGIRSTGTLNFYDGTIKGKENAINGNVTNIEDNSQIVNGTDGDYKTAYLETINNQDSIDPLILDNNSLNNNSLDNDLLDKKSTLNEVEEELIKEEKKEEIKEESREEIEDNENNSQEDLNLTNEDNLEENIEEDNKEKQETNIDNDKKDDETQKTETNELENKTDEKEIIDLDDTNESKEIENNDVITLDESNKTDESNDDLNNIVDTNGEENKEEIASSNEVIEKEENIDDPELDSKEEKEVINSIDNNINKADEVKEEIKEENKEEVNEKLDKKEQANKEINNENEKVNVEESNTSKEVINDKPTNEVSEKTETVQTESLDKNDDLNN